MDQSDRAAEMQLRLLAEAASDALERQAATRRYIEKVAEVRRTKRHLPWLWRRRR